MDTDPRWGGCWLSPGWGMRPLSPPAGLLCGLPPGAPHPTYCSHCVTGFGGSWAGAAMLQGLPGLLCPGRALSSWRCLWLLCVENSWSGASFLLLTTQALVVPRLPLLCSRRTPSSPWSPCLWGRTVYPCPGAGQGSSEPLGNRYLRRPGVNPRSKPRPGWVPSFLPCAGTGGEGTCHPG